MSDPKPNDTEAAAREVTYLRSAEHKRYPTEGGLPRSTASKCPKTADKEATGKALREGIGRSIRKGLHSRVWDGRFPRYVWGSVTVPDAQGAPEEVYFEARLTNRVSGEYKAWPINEAHECDALTRNLRKRIWPRT